ncbi:MAG TPA: ABC transporter ATP-binding protein, partial [Anaerolineaceae bacterium]|nr:ABC transporter ATP-binding protein [Anaerolineaceae bacterium]
CFNHILAVDDIDLHVSPGEVLALLGPNGAGKTTTVRMLTSVLRPTAGWARVAGFDVVKDAEQVRRSVGVLSEHHGLYAKMEAIDYLEFYGQLYGLTRQQSRERGAALLEQFGLAESRNRRLGEFSRGMRQKVALARTLLHDPPVILLDEPTSAMDPQSTRLVRDMIRQLRGAERAIFLCTHNLAEAEELADQIAIIRSGKIIARGSPAEIKLGLLGAAEYMVQFSKALPEVLPVLPAGIALVERGADWLSYQTARPNEDNPAFIQRLVEANLPPVSVQEAPRRLEDAYLKAIGQ